MRPKHRPLCLGLRVPDCDFGRSRLLQKLSVRKLGVNVDSALKFDKPINSVVKKPRVFLSFKELERVTHAFVSSRLEYCNSLYMGINQSNINRLQIVQNAATRLLTGTRGFDQFCYRIEFNIFKVCF